MKRFIEGVDRTQCLLLPDCVEDYVGPDNPVRVVEAFVEQLDLQALGFAGCSPEDRAAGLPPGGATEALHLGYLNRIQSTRRLEQETQRNLELIWLGGQLMPDFKTIANFRKDNPSSVRA